MANLDPSSTALILIDLQNGIVAMPLAPRPGTEVVSEARALAMDFRAAGGTVVLVNVSWANDFADAPQQLVDQPSPRPKGGLPAAWSALIDGLSQQGDLLITKRQWGAFHGTELDLQLRRRRIQTIVLGGIATNFGVESTARQAWEYGYDLLLVEDLCTATSSELHELSFNHILPRIGRVVHRKDISFLSH
jgi:nicotinamidase-related amidase